MRWLRPETQTKEQIIKAVMIERYTASLPFKPQNWVLCNQPTTLEEAISYMEAYVLAEAGMYLVPKNWHKVDLRLSLGPMEQAKGCVGQTEANLQH